MNGLNEEPKPDVTEPSTHDLVVQIKLWRKIFHLLYN